MVSNLFAEIDDVGERAPPPRSDGPAHDVHPNGHFESVTMFKPICTQLPRCKKENLEPVIELAVEIARQGREGRRIGTLFTFGDGESVLARSRPLILDPFAGHPDEWRNTIAVP
jgi:hypothetical protein